MTSPQAVSTVDSILYRTIADFKANDDQAKDLNDLFGLVPGHSSSVILESAKQLLDILGYISLDNFYGHDQQKLFEIGIQPGVGDARRFTLKVDQSESVAILPDMKYPIPLHISAVDYDSGYTPDPGKVVIDGADLFSLDSEGTVSSHSLNCIAYGTDLGTGAAQAGTILMIPVYYTRTDGHIILTTIQAFLSVEHGWTAGSGNIWFVRCQNIDGGGTYALLPSMGFTDINIPTPFVSFNSYGIKLKDAAGGLYPRDANNLPSDIEVQTPNDLFTLLSIPTGSGMESALSHLID